MIKLLVIADDFTGMLDTGVQFAKYSNKVNATTDYNTDFTSVPCDIEVLIIDTETRHASAEVAYHRLAKLYKRAKSSSIKYIYKKIDSVFRGNVGPELKAMADYLDTKNIALVPSYPDNNRIIKDGKLYIDRDLEDFSKKLYDIDLQKKLSREKISLITNSINDEDGDFLFMDAVSNGDLEKNLSYLVNKNLTNYVVGSAGFAEYYAKFLFDTKFDNSFDIKSPLIVVCGSLNKATRLQNDFVKRKGYPVISLGHELLTSRDGFVDEYETLVGSICENSRNNKIVVVETSSVPIDEENTTNDDPRILIGNTLGHITKSLMEKSIEGTFLFTGGDTLFWCMKVLEVSSIRPIAEIEPGVVVSKVNYMGKTINVITKSGGFGEESLYFEISNKYMKGE